MGIPPDFNMNDLAIPETLFRNISIGISILLVLTYAISRVTFPKMFAVVYDFSKLINFKIKDEFGSGIRLLSTENLYFTTILSASISFVVYNVFLFTPQFMEQIPWMVPSNFWIGILLWLLTTLAILLIFLLKYLFLALTGWLFNLPLNISRHYQEVQALNNCFVMALVILSTAVLYSNYQFPQIVVQLIGTGTLIYLFYRLLNVYIKLNQLGAYSKLYIFSYLCTTEITPAIIGLKLLV